MEVWPRLSLTARTAGLVALVCWLPGCVAQNLNPNSTNKQFVPEDVEANTPFCSIPPLQNQSEVFYPKPGLCTNNTEDILNDEATLQALAQAYAPFLYFHPRERFTMSSVQRTFDDPSEGRIWYKLNGLEVFDSQLRQSSLLQTTRDVNYVMHSHRFYFEHELDFDRNYQRGDGFDGNGLSNAPIYYRAFDSGNDTITFNYFMYYAWNGPASVGILTSLKRIPQYIRFRLPPFGVHEGDWESLSVTVCKSSIPSQPLSMTFRQHNFGQILDCTKGECTFHRDSPTNPVGFVTLDSHDVYPFSASEIVYAEAWPLEFILNLQGVLIVDRVSYADRKGNFRYYAPNTTNVVRIPEQQIIPEGLPDESFYWAAFGGNWGSSQDAGQDIDGEQPECLQNVTDGNATFFNSTVNTTDEDGECPTHEENPVFWYVMQMLGVEDAVDSIIAAAKNVRTAFRRLFADSFKGPLGPATNSFYNQLRFPGTAPLWDLPTVEQNWTAEDYCRKLTEPPSEDRFSTDIDILPLTKNIIGILFMCLAFTIFNIFYFLRKRNEDVRPVLLTDEQGRYLQPDRDTRRWVFLHAWIYTVAYILTFFGAMLFFVGYTALTDLLEDTFSGIDFHAVEVMFLALGIFILIIDSMLLIILWLRTEDLWRRINTTYFSIVGDMEQRKRFDPFEKRMCYSAEVVDVFFLVTFALLLVSLILAVVMVIVAVFNVGFAYAFGQICDEVIGALDGICLRFDALGLDEIRCGGEFQQFCNDWARRDMSATLWGAFIVICGHFYLIAAGGMAALSNRSVNRALLLYPSNEEYTKMLIKLGVMEAPSVEKPLEESAKALPDEKEAGDGDGGDSGESTEDQPPDEGSKDLEPKKAGFWGTLFGTTDQSPPSDFIDEGGPADNRATTEPEPPATAEPETPATDTPAKE